MRDVVVIRGHEDAGDEHLNPEPQAVLAARGHTVVGADDFSKYGKVASSFAGHCNHQFVEGTPGTWPSDRPADRLRLSHRRGR